MGNPLFPTEMSLAGPWLLNEDALKALDVIVQKHWSYFEKIRVDALSKSIDDLSSRSKKIGNALDEERIAIQAERISSSIGIYIYDDDDNSYEFDAFENALTAIQLIKRKINAFSFYMQSGEIYCTITLNEYEALKIKTGPRENEKVQAFFVELVIGLLTKFA